MKSTEILETGQVYKLLGEKDNVWNIRATTGLLMPERMRRLKGIGLPTKQRDCQGLTLCLVFMC